MQNTFYICHYMIQLWILNSGLVIKLDQILHRLPIDLNLLVYFLLVADVIIATPLITDQEHVHMSGNEVEMVL